MKFQKAPTAQQENAPPSVGLQFFGEVVISAASKEMTVNLRDLDGNILHTQVIAPEQ